MKSVRSSGKIKLSSYVKPMLATLHDTVFDDPSWLFELKLDGYRAIAEVGKDIKLYSRNGLSFLPLYPSIGNALQKFTHDAILDGEIVVLNNESKPDFQKLQQYAENPSATLVYYVFDCLSLDGKSRTNSPLIERKQLVQKIIPKNSIIRYADHVVGNGKDLFKHAQQLDLEGIIAKRSASLYHLGKRSADWLKLKNHNTQEAIIVGYTQPKGARKYFGALLLALYENGTLKYIGHTGTGFTERVLKEVYDRLQPLKRHTSPFDKNVPVRSSVTWVTPNLVCAVKFTEVTEDGMLRHPVFMGLRVDKHAEEATSIDRIAKVN